VPFPESSLNDEAGKNFMESYDEYAKRARLLAGVHGLTRWSSAPMRTSSAACVGEGKTPDDSDTDDHHLEKKINLDGKKSPATLPNNAIDSGNSSSGAGGKKLGKSTRGNIVRASSKTLDKISKKKSLKRL
jgi:ubiquitin-conjugating enzyme E2 S